jgi:hypothetical protein
MPQHINICSHSKLEDDLYLRATFFYLDEVLT